MLMSNHLKYDSKEPFLAWRRVCEINLELQLHPVCYHQGKGDDSDVILKSKRPNIGRLRHCPPQQHILSSALTETDVSSER